MPRAVGFVIRFSENVAMPVISEVGGKSSWARLCAISSWGDRVKQLKTRQETDDFLAVRLKSTNGRHLHDLSALFSNIDALGLKHNDGDFVPLSL